jgi:hypothetical protein
MSTWLRNESGMFAGELRRQRDESPFAGPYIVVMHSVI